MYSQLPECILLDIAIDVLESMYAWDYSAVDTETRSLAFADSPRTLMLPDNTFFHFEHRNLAILHSDDLKNLVFRQFRTAVDLVEHYHIRAPHVGGCIDE